MTRVAQKLTQLKDLAKGTEIKEAAKVQDHCRVPPRLISRPRVRTPAGHRYLLEVHRRPTAFPQFCQGATHTSYRSPHLPSKCPICRGGGGSQGRSLSSREACVCLRIKSTAGKVSREGTKAEPWAFRSPQEGQQGCRQSAQRNKYPRRGPRGAAAGAQAGPSASATPGAGLRAPPFSSQIPRQLALGSGAEMTPGDGCPPATLARL